jgi:hypothetical protein
MKRVECGENLSSCVEEPVAADIPVPVNRALLDLCERARTAGMGDVARKEMLAAVVFSVTGPNIPSKEEVADMLQRYRLAEAAGHLPAEAQERGYHEFEERKAGRPRKRR